MTSRKIDWELDLAIVRHFYHVEPLDMTLRRFLFHLGKVFDVKKYFEPKDPRDMLQEIARQIAEQQAAFRERMGAGG